VDGSKNFKILFSDPKNFFEICFENSLKIFERERLRRSNPARKRGHGRVGCRILQVQQEAKKVESGAKKWNLEPIILKK